MAWVLPSAIGRYYTQMLALAGIYVVVAQGLNLLAGYTGQASLGHAGFYAIGAYTGALLATKLGLGFWSAMPFSILVAAAAGVLIALPSFKLDGPYLAMVTIAFGIIVNSILIEWSRVDWRHAGRAQHPATDARRHAPRTRKPVPADRGGGGRDHPVSAQSHALAVGPRFRRRTREPDRRPSSGLEHTRSEDSRLHHQCGARRRRRASLRILPGLHQPRGFRVRGVDLLLDDGDFRWRRHSGRPLGRRTDHDISPRAVAAFR